MTVNLTTKRTTKESLIIITVHSFFDWRRTRTDSHEGLEHTPGVQGGGALLAHPEVPHTTAVPNAHLRTQPCGGQVPLLVLRVTAEEDEEVIRGDRVLWAGIREVPPACEELRHLAAL